MRVLGSGGAKLAAQEARRAKNGPEKAVLDRKWTRMNANMTRVATGGEMGGGVGVVGRGCTPGGIGVDKTARQPCKAGLHRSIGQNSAKNGPKRRFWTANGRKWTQMGLFRAQPEGWTTNGVEYVVHASAWGYEEIREWVKFEQRRLGARIWIWRGNLRVARYGDGNGTGTGQNGAGPSGETNPGQDHDARAWNGPCGSGLQASLAGGCLPRRARTALRSAQQGAFWRGSRRR